MRFYTDKTHTSTSTSTFHTGLKKIFMFEEGEVKKAMTVFREDITMDITY